MEKSHSLKDWLKSGEPFIWLNAVAVSISVIAVVGLITLLLVRGFTHFWPTAILEVEYQRTDGDVVTYLGQVRESEQVLAEQIESSGIKLPGKELEVIRKLVQTGNRDVSGGDFRWLLEPFMSGHRFPADAMVVERREWGNLYGYLIGLSAEGQQLGESVKGKVLSDKESWQAFQQSIDRSNDIHHRIRKLEQSEIGAINYRMEKLRLKERGIELGKFNESEVPALRDSIAAERAALDAEYQVLQAELGKLYTSINRDSFQVRLSDGTEMSVPVAKVVRAYQPNKLSLWGKVAVYMERLWEFVAHEPREANTEGGIFPAIFGTVLMVIVMSIIVTPLGIVAAVYLREYARQGALTRMIRIAVNNLAGVPSIVYGVFGLGFFVYMVGGRIDQLFYQEGLPSPTFGTPGLIWASLTLALLTLPVVIVATEEGLARLPRSLREGSLALGATKFQTITQVILPTASPALMTGLILAVARAAGEVAPLMLVGVVKLAPTLPLDANFPFLHLERKFMHLGFHIYDVGFQSPNVEAARPLVYATALLLVAVIVILNLTAINVRNRLREKYKALEM